MVVERFAGRLKELRIRAGLSQQELADKAGIKLGAVRDLEQGRNGPTWETVLHLCAALGVSCEAFTHEPQPAPPPERGRPKKDAGHVEAPAPNVKAKKRKEKQ
jgi:transcriptional regulator with XRE-family HTH domain